MNVEPPSKGFKTFVLLLFLGTGAFFITKIGQVAVSTRSRARATEAPKEVQITNVTPTSASITWKTSVPTTEYVLYKTNSGSEESAFTSGLRRNHEVTLLQLLPNTSYQFRIGVGSKAYTKDGEPFKFSTTHNFSSGESYKVFGQVVDLRKEPARDTLVYLTLKDADSKGSKGLSATLSNMTNSNGLFSMNLQDVTTLDLTSPFYYSKLEDTAEITAFGETGEQVSVLLTIGQLQPTPLLQLSTEKRLLDLRGQKDVKGSNIILHPKMETEKEVESLLQKFHHSFTR